MTTTFERRIAAREARFLSSLTAESVFFGVVGAGHPNSFYRVFVRRSPKSRRWWRFETTAGPSLEDPPRRAARLHNPAEAITGPLPHLPLYRFLPGAYRHRTALRKSTRARGSV